MTAQKPLPTIDVWSRPFWEAAKREELLVQKCADCAHHLFPPGPVCPACQSGALIWVEVSGKAIVESWVVFHQLYFKGFEPELPYNVAMVRLEEGPLLMTNVAGIDNAELRRGMTVQVTFDALTEEITVPRFVASGQGHEHG